jgi:hypothetical protein
VQRESRRRVVFPAILHTVMASCHVCVLELGAVIGVRIRAWLVASLLWMQLKVIYSSNDYLEYEWHIPYTRPWRYVPVPVYRPRKRVYRELRSAVMISKLLKVCHCVGTKVLGMKAKYEEYEVDIGDSMWVDKECSFVVTRMIEILPLII